jgi:hypothetical protein
MWYAHSYPLRILATAFVFALLALGCGDDAGIGRTVPVSGMLTVGNEPWTLETTTVLFKPDAAKGNTSLFEPIGTVDAEGQYTLSTKGKPGAPPGWYRVIVTATGTRAEVSPKGPRHHPIPVSLLPAKYGQAKTTDLLLEVVENPAPGAYDLKLSR